MGPIVCSETSVKIYHYMLHKNLEVRRFPMNVTRWKLRPYEEWTVAFQTKERCVELSVRAVWDDALSCSMSGRFLRQAVQTYERLPKWRCALKLVCQGLWKLMHWKDRRPRPNKDVQAAAVYRFQQRHSNFFAEGIDRLVCQRDACLSAHGDHFWYPLLFAETILQWVMSGFRTDINEISTLLAFYAA